MRDRHRDRHGARRLRSATVALAAAVALSACSSADDTAIVTLAFDTEPAAATTTARARPVAVDPTTTTATTSTTTTTVAPTTTTAPVVEVAPPTVPAASSVDPTAPPTPDTAAAGATYATLPDGTPAPVVAVFDTDLVTLSGAVPTEADRQQLEALAIATSKTPASVANLLTVDPTVPIGVGVRVVELTSSRFPEGSSEVVPEYAKELDRLVAVMNAFPTTTVLVIGHADQIGDEQSNYVLSAARAAAVVDYLTTRAGIAASRLASRAVGENDLLTLNSDEASLAMNRRTEFVVYGLLAAA
jgi:outer membrane protein OmpA-like peptidoglycan-associated protein